MKHIYTLSHILVLSSLLFVANASQATKTDIGATDKIKIVSPFDGQENLSRQPEIVIQTVDPIDPTSITMSLIDVEPKIRPTIMVIPEYYFYFPDQSKYSVAIHGEYTLSSDKRTLTFKPAGLNVESKYVITVSGLRSIGLLGSIYVLPEVTSVLKIKIKVL